jgi:hypothetical protein
MVVSIAAEHAAAVTAAAKRFHFIVNSPILDHHDLENEIIADDVQSQVRYHAAESRILKGWDL